jgi:two-component system chemotaxis sensor kinase CheA
MFEAEAQELLAELETTLLELEGSPGDGELVARAFRAMHTLKGSSGMFGFDEVAAFTHDLESLFDHVRAGRLGVTTDLVDAALRARDHIRGLLAGEAAAADGAPLTERLKQLAAAVGGAPAGAAPGTVAGPRLAAPSRAAEEPAVTFRIRFRPAVGLFASGTNPLLLFAELRELGPLHVVAQTRAVPPLEDLDPESCQLHWDLLLTTPRPRSAIDDVFLFVADDGNLTVEAIHDDGDDGGDAPDYKQLGELLVERGDLSAADIERALAKRPRLGEVLQAAGLVSSGQVEAALLEQEVVREQRRARVAGDGAGSMRVAAAKLDRLVDLVGELVIAQARVSQLAARLGDGDLLLIAEDVERLTAELRDNTLDIRMLPIGATFGSFRRLVRDLSGELGKQVELRIEGADTELDKTVIERLQDPLVHLLRNCIDHGLEDPAGRERAGKPAVGSVLLSARHAGANVVIEVKDDGRGLDPEAIRRKAVERGLLSADAEVPEKELFGLIFAAGFSTAKTVSNVSGRGVGMDVVRRSVEALRGTVDVESRRGAGTTVRIRLPLTLAIIEGLLVRVGAEAFVLPLAAVEECVELTRAEVRRSHGHRVVDVRDQLVPYVRLRDWFAVPGDQPHIEQVVVVELDGLRFGFVVDHVVGQHQTVIKSLGRFHGDVEGLSGATILGDGTVALILDMGELVGAALRAAEADAAA